MEFSDGFPIASYSIAAMLATTEQPGPPRKRSCCSYKTTHWDWRMRGEGKRRPHGSCVIFIHFPSFYCYNTGYKRSINQEKID